MDSVQNSNVWVSVWIHWLYFGSVLIKYQSRWPRQEAARVFGFHAQCHQAWRLVVRLRTGLKGMSPQTSLEAVQGVQAIDAWMVRMRMMWWVSWGCGHSHKPMSMGVCMGMRVRSHAGRRHAVCAQDTAPTGSPCTASSRPQVTLHLWGERDDKC